MIFKITDFKENFFPLYCFSLKIVGKSDLTGPHARVHFDQHTPAWHTLDEPGFMPEWTDSILTV